MGKKYPLIFVAFFLSALSSVLNFLPFVFLWFITKEIFANSLDLELILIYAILATSSVLVASLAYFVALVCSHIVAFRVEVNIRKIAMQKIINMPLGFFSKYSSGFLRKIIDENASETHTFIAHQSPDLWASVVAPLVLFVLLFVFDYRLGLVSLIPFGLGILTTASMMSKKGDKFRQEYMSALESMSAHSVEYIRGISVVKIFGGSVFAFKDFVKSIKDYKEMVVGYTRLWNKQMAFYSVTTQSLAFFLVPFVVLLITQKNQADLLSDFLFYLLIAPNFAVIFMRSMYYNYYLKQTNHILDKLDDVLDYAPMEFKDLNKTPKNLDLEFKNVSFSYEGAKCKAIDNLSFCVKQGKSVALVGTSGSGKTTIARLVARFWDVLEGEILIGGVNIKDLSKEFLYSNISFVFQNTKLFNASLKDNLRLNKTYTQDEIKTALDLSYCSSFVQNLAQGLETTIGTKGVYLSGGQAQRLSIARAILKNAPLVILDEATAFSDVENEALINASLKNLSKNKTSIFIAHRLSSIVDVDEILVLEKGKIVERGNHETLLQKGEIYKKMWDEYKKSISWRVK